MHAPKKPGCIAESLHGVSDALAHCSFWCAGLGAVALIAVMAMKLIPTGEKTQAGRFQMIQDATGIVRLDTSTGESWKLTNGVWSKHKDSFILSSSTLWDDAMKWIRTQGGKKSEFEIVEVR